MQRLKKTAEMRGKPSAREIGRAGVPKSQTGHLLTCLPRGVFVMGSSLFSSCTSSELSYSNPLHSPRWRDALMRYETEEGKAAAKTALSGG